MTVVRQPFAKPPIVEAVVDIDVEMRPGFVLAAARDRLVAAFGDRYPVSRVRESETHEIHPQPGSVGEVRSRLALEVSVRRQPSCPATSRDGRV